MNMAVSGTTEVVVGGATRFVGGALTTGGNLKEAWAQTINPQSILFDATLGASMGGVKGLQKPQQINANLNTPKQSNADVKPLENTVKHQDSLKNESGSQPYAPTYHVVDEMMNRDKSDLEIYNPSTGYPKNPTARNIADSIVYEHVEIDNKIPNGPVTYVMDESGNIIIGKRNNPINKDKRSPHPMLIGGKNPQVQCAGMIHFKKGKIISIDNQSGHFRPNSQSMDKVYETLKKLYENNPKVFAKEFEWR